MVFTYTFGRPDLDHYQLFLIRTSPYFRRQRWGYMLGWGAFFLFAVLTVALKVRAFEVTLIASIASALVYGFMAFNYDGNIRKALRRSADELRSGAYGNHQLILSDEGMREITPVTDSFVKWQNVVDVVLDDTHAIVRLASSQAAIINRSTCSGPVPIDQLPKVINDFKAKVVG